MISLGHRACHLIICPAPRGVPEFRSYVEALAVIVPLWFLLFRAHGLYEPHRTRTLSVEATEVLRATVVGVVVSSLGSSVGRVRNDHVRFG